MSSFMGRTISKETISLGLGGQIERAGEDFAPKSKIRFEACAVFSSVKHKFATDGTVEEAYILVIDPATFRVLDVAEAAQEPKLPL